VTQQITLPDVETVLIGWLTGQMTQIRCCSSLPEDLDQLVKSTGVLQVRRVSGLVSHRNQDQAFVDVNAFALDDASASQLAIQTETLILGAINVTTGDAVLRNTASVVRPRWLPYADTNVQLYAATYTVRLHSAPAAA
jgi:hypothetical protein